MTKLAWFFLCVLVLCAPEAALAEDLDEFERLTEHGHEQFSSGDYAGALVTFEQAAQHHSGCPTATLWAGKSLEQLGLLGEALDVYRGIATLQLPPGATQACRDAQLEASVRQAELEGGVGRLDLTVHGAGDDLVVSIAGRPRPLRPFHRGQGSAGAGAAGAPTWQLPLEAGEFQVEVSSAGVSGSDTVQVQAGKTSPLLIDLRPTETPKAVAAPLQAVPRSAPAVPSEDPSGWSQSSWGWVAIGVGAVGVATGTVTGVLVLGDVDEVEAECSPALGLCSDPGLKTQERASGLATISSVAWGVGIVGVAGGLVLLLTDHAATAPERAETSTWQPRALVSAEGTWLGVDGRW